MATPSEDKSASRDYQRIESALRFLQERAESQPSLQEVATAVGLTQHHLQRLFTLFAGVSPKRFVQVLTAKHARELLRGSKTVLETALEVGLSGPSRLHDLMVAVDAMTPGECRALGAGITIRCGFHSTPFGACAIAVTQRGVCGLDFGVDVDDAHAWRDALVARWPGASVVEDSVGTLPLVEQIFAQPAGTQERPTLDVRGTNFQVRVWQALLQIPEGAVISYGDLAGQLGAPGAARAVGSAVGKNPVGYLIPCHRVLRGSGVLGDYRWGSLRKRAMLAREWCRATAENEPE